MDEGTSLQAALLAYPKKEGYTSPAILSKEYCVPFFFANNYSFILLHPIEPEATYGVVAERPSKMQGSEPKECGHRDRFIGMMREA
jgi:hypothetical protein